MFSHFIFQIWTTSSCSDADKRASRSEFKIKAWIAASFAADRKFDAKVVFVGAFVLFVADVSVEPEKALFDFQICSFGIDLFGFIKDFLHKRNESFFLLLVEVVMCVEPLRVVVCLHGLEEFQGDAKH